MLPLLAACVTPAPDTGVLDPEATPPALTEIAVVCDGRQGKWSLDANTDAWTGGGELLLSTDGADVEAHPVPSVEAALDGTSDHLKLSLTVVSDFRKVNPGSSTAFNCGTPDLEGLFVVYDRSGSVVTDCRDFGPEPTAWAEWALGDCAETISVAPA